MSKPIRAVAVFDTKKIKGVVYFTEIPNKNTVKIDINVSGLKKNGKHGFHIHECGDVTQSCKSMCAHFNPYGVNHGGQDSKIRHVGDLGNLVTDKNGIANYSIEDSMIKLKGSKCNILGRGLIIHEDEDDCGLGGIPLSLTTGNSGDRIACAVIGYASPIVH